MGDKQATKVQLEQSLGHSLLFQQLPGTWTLHRELQSTNATEPSGRCTGTATFTTREPSVFVDADGKLQQARAELVYHEVGEFELYQAGPGFGAVPRFPFSRKYIWRLSQVDDDHTPMVLSVWFTKPGTDIIDYLFHKVDMQSERASADLQLQTGRCLEGSGCHLCEEDLYNSTYTFQLSHATGESSEPDARLRNWMMVHEVRGPGKEQYIETKFSRSGAP